MAHLPPRFLSEDIIQRVEDGCLSKYQFVSRHCRCVDEPSEDICGVCWEELIPPARNEDGSSTNMRLDVIANDKCPHRFHRGCFAQIIKHVDGGQGDPSSCPYRCCKWYDTADEIEDAEFVDAALERIEASFFDRPMNRYMWVDAFELERCALTVGYAATKVFGEEEAEAGRQYVQLLINIFKFMEDLWIDLDGYRFSNVTNTDLERWLLTHSVNMYTHSRGELGQPWGLEDDEGRTDGE